MTPRDFLDGFRSDKRLVTGGYYPHAPVELERDDVVGVVLMNGGGPTEASAVPEFLYRRAMDPAAFDVPLPAPMRDALARFVAGKRAPRVARDYAQIGWASPLNRHTREQARAVEQRLNDRFGAATGARFRTYVATRYGDATSEAAAAEMTADGVTKVVLLPLYPQYARTTTGASVAYWKALEESGEAPVWPTSLVYEYAAHPKYVQAISERIDEALRRLPREDRERAPLVFSAKGTPRADLMKRRDPYCCLVHATVQEVMRLRDAHDPGRTFRVAFQSGPATTKWLNPDTADTLVELAEEGHSAVVVVPVACVSDHVGTAFELDITVRERAHEAGIERFEVTTGLNCHPLFVEALAECVAAQVTLPAVGGDGAPEALPASIPALPRYSAAERDVRCDSCPMLAEAHDWRGQPAVRVPAPDGRELTACPVLGAASAANTAAGRAPEGGRASGADAPGTARAA